MPTILQRLTIVLCGAIAMSAAAVADPAVQSDATVPPDTAVTTGSVYRDPTPEQRMADCMAIWEPRTHMTKREWRRTCQTTLKEFD
ncbi:MAG: hypothetical protein H7Y62_01860 [Hyphomicrobium sp.]|nr:hypothetical protein [Hyphomicrobium sp.]